MARESETELGPVQEGHWQDLDATHRVALDSKMRRQLQILESCGHRNKLDLGDNPLILQVRKWAEVEHLVQGDEVSGASGLAPLIANIPLPCASPCFQVSLFMISI